MPVGSDPRPGSLIAGYRLEDLLARGGMGAVYRAEDMRLGRKVALKLLAPEFAESERFRERFLRESRLAASLDHPHIVPIYAAGEAEGQLYLAMRYVEGYDLRGLLAQEGPLVPERTLRLLEQVADALDAAHEHGLIHRDVKPGNVLIAGRSGREHCYLADFGLTKQTASMSGLTGTGELVGTVEYVSPEQIRGELVDGRADVYALGCVLYECLAGDAPFARETEVATLWAHVNEPPPRLAAIRPELGTAIDHVLEGALAKAPADREESCRELVASAAASLGLPSATAPPRPPRRHARPVRLPGRRLLTLVAGAAAVLIASAAVLLVVLLHDTGSGTSRVGPGSVGVIDPKTNQVVDAIPLGFKSSLIAAGKGHVWVVDPERSTLTKIDPQTRKIVDRLPIEAGATPTGLAVGQGSVWVGVIRSSGLALLEFGPELGNPRSTTVVEHGTFSVGRESVLPAVGKDMVFTLETGRGEVSRVADGTATPLTEGGLDANSIATAGDAIWLGGLTSVTKIDARTGKILVSVPVGGLLVSTSTSIQVTDNAVWFAGTAQPWLFKIDPTGRSETKFPVCGHPSGIAVGEGAVWVACADGTVSRVNANGTVPNISIATPPAGIVADFGEVWTSPGR